MQLDTKFLRLRTAVTLGSFPSQEERASLDPSNSDKSLDGVTVQPLTPDTAHGTNPATVTMAGYEVVKFGTDKFGNAR